MTEIHLGKYCEAKEGYYYPEEHYSQIIKEECSVYDIDTGKILAILCKGVIPVEDRQKYKDILRSPSRSKTKNRGNGAGKCDIKRFPPQAHKLVDKNNNPIDENKTHTSVFYQKEDGSFCNRGQSNLVRSGCAGYFDKRGKLPCRQVAWSNKNPEKHNALIPLCECIADKHKEVDEESYNKQLERIMMKPEYRFGESIYSTLTLNYDFRTASHRDKGDFKAGLSTLTILEDIPGNYEGLYLGLPEYKICFDVRDGDILFFDTHQIHCNTEYKVLSDKLGVNNIVDEDGVSDKYFAGRISIVAYLRERLYLCAD